MSLLTLENVSLHFNNSNRPTLNNFNYQVQAGDFIILLGSNGSGKSSLLKLLYRHYHPSKGRISFLNKSIYDFSEKTFSQHVAMLTQTCADSLFTSLTLYENYLLVKKHKKISLINHKAEKNFLMDYLNDYNPNLSKKLNLPVSQLSGGEMQALTLAFCLLEPPSLLLLDEHTSALDPKTSDQIMQLTQRKIIQHNMTCILTTHNLEIALQYGNRLLALREGKILNMVDENKLSLSKADLMVGYY